MTMKREWLMKRLFIFRPFYLYIILLGASFFFPLFFSFFSLFFSFLVRCHQDPRQGTTPPRSSGRGGMRTLNAGPSLVTMSWPVPRASGALRRQKWTLASSTLCGDVDLPWGGGAGYSSTVFSAHRGKRCWAEPQDDLILVLYIHYTPTYVGTYLPKGASPRNDQSHEEFDVNDPSQFPS